MAGIETPRCAPVAVDLFAGAGGFSLGVSQAGWDLAACVEIDPIHVRTHKLNLPHCETIVADAAAITASDIRSRISSARKGWNGIVDLVVGGPPCQGFSSGGHQQATDVRNDLVLEFARLVVELRPRVFAMENVRGLLGDRYDSIRSRFKAALEAAGYTLVGMDSWIQCRDLGLPQDRKRVVVRGALDARDLGELIPMGGEGHTVADALSGLPDVRLRRDGGSIRRLTPGQRERLLAFRDTSYGQLIDPPDTRPDSSARPLANCRVTEHSGETRARFSRTLPGEVEPVSRYFRLAASGVSRTLRAGTAADRGSYTAPRPIHPRRNRVLTVRESARIQGFPDWFVFDETVWHGQRQVGNSVPPPVARAIARSLVEGPSLTDLPESSEFLEAGIDPSSGPRMALTVP